MTKIHIVTFGCTHNQSDSEVMAGLLKNAGFDIVDRPDNAQLIIINSCSVKNLAETKFFKAIREIEKNHPKKKIILAGCIPQADKKLVEQKLKNYSIIGTSQLTKIVDVVVHTLMGDTIQILVKEKNPRLNLPKIRKNKIVEIVPISEGCLDNCAFCKTKQARGSLFSYDKNAIIKQTKSALKDGCKEIWLTSQDCAIYGFDLTPKTNLAELLRDIVKINSDFKIRVGMANPHHIFKFLDDLIEIYKNKKLFKFLHVPVQSGNNEILKLMKRKYNVEKYKEIINKFKKEIPDLTISTDIICGFPTETEEQFQDSISLVKETKPDIINISRFWLRPGTAAEKLKQLPGGITKKRSVRLNKIFNKIALENNKKWIGWKGSVLIDEKGKLKKGKKTWMGRNASYKPIVVEGKSKKFKLGQKINVRIVDVSEHYLKGEKV